MDGRFDTPGAWQCLKVIDLGELTEVERAELQGDEIDPFDSAGVTLRYRPTERHVVIRDGEQLVAAAGLTTATVSVADRRFEVVGLGGVIVRAERRGEGLARLVIEEALVRARPIGPAFVALFCHADRAGLYERLGFYEVRSPVHVQQPDGFKPSAQLMMWRNLEPGASWPAGEVTLLGLPF
jgi:predicted N-acetyltransferase YhbS